MGLMDKLTGGAMGGNSMMGAVMGLLNQQGGVGGLVSRFHQNGMGHVADSWVGTGENLPVEPDQMQRVMGQDTMQSLSRQTGMDSAQLSGHLSRFLPEIVNRLTPNGQIPQGPITEDHMQSTGIGGMIGKLFGNDRAA